MVRTGSNLRVLLKSAISRARVCGPDYISCHFGRAPPRYQRDFQCQFCSSWTWPGRPILATHDRLYSVGYLCLSSQASIE